ncbi:hypothetical protein UlMin_006457 [Ulmus minor]
MFNMCNNILVPPHGLTMQGGPFYQLAHLMGRPTLRNTPPHRLGHSTCHVSQVAGGSYTQEIQLHILTLYNLAPTTSSIVIYVLPMTVAWRSDTLSDSSSHPICELTLAPSQLYQTCLPLPSPPPPASSSSSFSSTSAPPSPMETFVAQKTNKVDAIDPILRRSGRFDAEIEVSTPNEEECFQIIKLYTKKIPMDSSADLQVVAASCNGYFGADLEALCRKASISAIKHSSDLNEDDSAFSLTMEDWKHDCGCFMKLIILTFSHGQKKLQQAVEWPFKHSTSFTRLGITLVRGILLHGHPGCSKTTLAKAAAHVAQASFFSLSGAELYSMYAGDGEPLLLLVGSSLLARISSSTPAIIDASCLSAEGCCCC